MSAVAFPMDPLIPKLNKALVKAAAKKPALLRGVLKTVAEAVLEYIVSQWPVDTATSLAGWGVRTGGKSWEVFNPVEYTSHVHDGIAETLYKTALGRAVGPANALLKSRVARAASKPGTRQRRTVTPQSMGRIVRPAVKSVAVTDRVLIRAVARSVATYRIDDALKATVTALVRKGLFEAAIRALVKGGRRSEARHLAKVWRA